MVDFMTFLLTIAANSMLYYINCNIYSRHARPVLTQMSCVQLYSAQRTMNLCSTVNGH